TWAATTVLLGKNIDSNGKIDFNGGEDSGNIDETLISLTYTGKVRFVITNQFGEFYGNSGKEHLEFLDIQAGYPVVNNKSGIFYLTLTGIKYSGYLNYSVPYFSKHEADGGLVGFEVISFPTDKAQFELGLHRAVGGSYRIDFYNSTLEMTLLKLKIQYHLTDNLGLVILTQFRDFQSKSDTLNVSEEINTTMLGFIYRL
ncbi:MAG: hypothetical protein ACM3YE_01405, partial [Bacteroidota bacterium]